MRNLIVASTSTVHGSGYLEYLLNELEILFNYTDQILFIPYARPSGLNYQDYTAIANKAFQKIGKTVKGIHEFENPKEAISKAKGIFTGGGNTFVLVNQLYKNGVLETMQEAIDNGEIDVLKIAQKQ